MRQTGGPRSIPRPRPRRGERPARGVRADRLSIALCLALSLARAAPAAAASTDTARTGPPWVLSINAEADDDPHVALARARDRLSEASRAGDRRAAFWSQLAVARAQTAFEDIPAATRSLELARGLLEHLPQPVEAEHLWLELDSIAVASLTDDARQVSARVARLRPGVAAAGDPQLSCELTSLDLLLLGDARSYDEAWGAAEELERCGQQLHQPLAVAAARSSLARMTGLLHPDAAGFADAQRRFTRALEALGTTPARLRRATIHWEFGLTLRHAGRLQDAIVQLRATEALGRSIHDDLTVALAAVGIASAMVEANDPAAALPLLREAQGLLKDEDDRYRLVDLYEVQIRALARLRRPEVLEAIRHSRRWDTAALQPAQRLPLVRAIAEGYASLGNYAKAYAELMRAEQLDAAVQSIARDAQVLRLQARYEASRREAENAQLRHRNEAALLQVQVQTERQRALTAALIALATLSASAGYFGWRMFADRRELASLALRDELTGQPNRRAIAAYARTQLQQARRLRLPLCLAMIDLDHFKRVNDMRGHAYGDLLLKGFAASVSTALRGQDRLGRWGGEEWLLVLPGLSLAGLGSVFARLREAFANVRLPGDDAGHRCTFSMGAVQVRDDEQDVDDLVAGADRQLYRAKVEGRDALRYAER